MSMMNLLNQFRLSDDIVARLGDVLVIATEHGDSGVVDWVYVAMTYAVDGKLRDRDLSNLSRLEGIYNSDFYRGPTRTDDGVSSLQYV